jgi:hypothetical protein
MPPRAIAFNEQYSHQVVATQVGIEKLSDETRQDDLLFCV